MYVILKYSTQQTALLTYPGEPIDAQIVKHKYSFLVKRMDKVRAVVMSQRVL